MQIKCPSCQKILKVRDEFAGRKARCPACQSVLLIPNTLGALPAGNDIALEGLQTPDTIAEKGMNLQEGTNRDDALKELETACQEFSRQQGRKAATLGSLCVLLALIGGCVGWVSHSWLLGLGIWLVPTIVLGTILGLLFESGISQAKKKVGSVQKRYGLSSEDAFQLLTEHSKANEPADIHSFTKAVWERKAPAKTTLFVTCMELFKEYGDPSTAERDTPADSKGLAWLAACHLMHAEKVNICYRFTDYIGLEETRRSSRVSRTNAREFVKRALKVCDSESGFTFCTHLLARAKGINAPLAPEIARIVVLNPRLYVPRVVPQIEFEAIAVGKLTFEDLSRFIAEIPGHEWLVGFEGVTAVSEKTGQAPHGKTIQETNGSLGPF
jgi:hypothetical protein